jgi:hydroxymethylglutaryl-CoA reductase
LGRTRRCAERGWLEHNTGHALTAAADPEFAPEQVRGNIENLVGAARVFARFVFTTGDAMGMNMANSPSMRPAATPWR